MRLILPAAALAVLAAGAAACAPTASDGSAAGASSQRQCFTADRIQNFRTNANRSLYVRAAGGQVFELQASAGCNDLSSAMSIALSPGNGGIDRLCVGDWTNVAIRGGVAPPTPSPCRARVVKALTPAEVEALPARDRP